MHRLETWCLALLLGLSVTPPAAAYDSQVHQRLTFYAARILNRCLEGSEVAALTPLQVRFVATSNMGLANSNALVRFFRWSYFDASERDQRSFLWIINTSFLEHFEQVAERARDNGDPAERYRELGRIVSYIQLVSSPSRAVPVYSARFWRGSFTDRFDNYRVGERDLEAALDDDCRFLADVPESYREILESVAEDTLVAVRSPIGGLPTTWEAFWEPDEDPGEFGEYGPAGNSFGRKVEFPCNGDEGSRCVLIDDDPLYLEFAVARQLAAIHGTARAMYLHQLLHGDRPAERLAESR